MYTCEFDTDTVAVTGTGELCIISEGKDNVYGTGGEQGDNYSPTVKHVIYHVYREVQRTDVRGHGQHAPVLDCGANVSSHLMSSKSSRKSGSLSTCLSSSIKDSTLWSLEHKEHTHTHIHINDMYIYMYI